MQGQTAGRGRMKDGRKLGPETLPLSVKALQRGPRWTMSLT
jgi:hypothetical protein